MQTAAVKVKDSLSDRLFLGGVYAFLILGMIVILYPLIYVFSNAFSSPAEVLDGSVWLWPIHVTLIGFRAAFQDGNIISGFLNSAYYTIVGTIVNVVLTIAIAYPLSRRVFFGRSTISFILAFTLFFSGGLIPYYVVTQDLHLVNTRWSQIIPSAIAVWQVIIARTFFQNTIPDDLAEAAEIDGCSDFRFLLQIVLPLSKPIIAVLALMYAVWHWNSYFDALIFLQSDTMEPLQIVLRNILILNSVNTSTMQFNVHSYLIQQGLINVLQYAVIVIASLPMLIAYPFVQKHFVKGVMIGSLKG